MKLSDFRGVLPVLMIDVIFEITQHGLAVSKEQLDIFEQIKERPYLLNDTAVINYKNIIVKQERDTKFLASICEAWRNTPLTAVQIEQVTKIESNIKLLQSIHQQIFFILDHCKNFTINKILQKDDLQLKKDIQIGMKTNQMDFPDIQTLEEMFKEFCKNTHNDKDIQCN